MTLTSRFSLFLLAIAVVVALATSHMSRSWIARHLRPTANAGFATVAEAAKPAVVNVAARRRVALPPSPGLMPEGPGESGGDGFEAPSGPFERPGGRARVELENLASGFAIRDDGTIVTSSQAVQGAERVTVRFAGDREARVARVVGTDPATDLAVVKVAGAKPTETLSFADPDSTRTGDWVVAIGNPFGLEQTVTAGIISATDRPVGHGLSGDFLQVNASLNPGDSGGPLLNDDGEVVGVTSGAFRQGAGSVGIAFAVPADEGSRVIEQLEKNGRVIRPWLGVTAQELKADVAQALGAREHTGLLVADLDAEGPAAQAGIQRGDIVVAYEGKEIRLARDLQRSLTASRVGDRVAIEVIRDGKHLDVTATIAEAPTPRSRLEGGPRQLSTTVEGRNSHVG